VLINVDAQADAPAVPAVAQPLAPPPWQNTPVVPTQQLASSTKGGCMPTVLIVLTVLALVAVLGVGGLVYAGYKMKQKATAVLHDAGIVGNAAARPNDTTPGSAPQPASADASAAPSSFAPWKPASATASGGTAPAPLKEGMLVVTAVGDASGDYESFKQITSIDANGVTLSYKSEHPKSGGGGSAPSPETGTSRTVLTNDLASAHDYAEIFGNSDPPSFPGSTAISASHDVLAELKERGTTQFTFRPDGLKGAVSSLVNALGGIAGIDPKSIGDGSLAKASKEECALQRLEDGSVAFPVLLNGEATKLPAVHAHCVTDDGPADFYILDQPDYPLMLSWKLGQGSQLQVIKITYPLEKKAPAPKMEQDLEEKKKVEIYGIYFDFASDRLKPESTPVLDEIAQVMKKHPDWRLSVSGHTDNIGGDAYNLDLSKRRAAAVKQALVARYHIAPDHLSTNGYGSSSPIDTNDTLEGRARNRRVELTRE
jgi:outer membrane protein OmpA-like peptidoglycan-associated protein